MEMGEELPALSDSRMANVEGILEKVSERLNHCKYGARSGASEKAPLCYSVERPRSKQREL